MRKEFWLFISVICGMLLYILFLTMHDIAAKPDPLGGKRIIVVLKSVGQPMDFWSVVRSGMREAARESGVEIDFMGPPHERYVDEQVKIFYRALAKKPDLIILAAGDFNRLVTPVEAAEEMGIPVVTLDSGLNSPIPRAFVATDNVAAGEKAGREMARLLKNTDNRKIIIISHSQGTGTAIDREDGVRKALKDFPVQGTWYCDIDYEKAYYLTLDLLEEMEVDGIVGLNEVATLGVADAVADLGLQEQIVIVGFDNARREMAYLEAGIIQATVVQRPFNMGYLALKASVDVLLGKKVPPFTDTGSILITRENMFLPEYQGVLFPFGELSNP